MILLAECLSLIAVAILLHVETMNGGISCAASNFVFVILLLGRKLSPGLSLKIVLCVQLLGLSSSFGRPLL